jgi:hypothetical protein
MNRSEAMVRLFVVSLLAAVVVCAAGGRASAQPAAPKPFPVDVKGTAGVNVMLFVDNGKFAEGTFNAAGDFSSLLDFGNSGKSKVTVYVDVCKDGQIVKVMLVTGAPPPKDDDCHRTVAGTPFYNDCGVTRLTINVLKMFAQPVGCGKPFTTNRLMMIGGTAVGGSLIAIAAGGGSTTTSIASAQPPPISATTTPVTTTQPQPPAATPPQPPPVTTPPQPPPATTPSAPSIAGNFRCIACTIKFDPSNHNPTLRWCDGLVSLLTVALQGSGLTMRHPAPFIEVTGSNYSAATGAFELSGTGSIAGFNNVSVRVVGTFDPQTGRLTFDCTLGGNGVFPGGQPITYSATFQLQQ